MKRREFIGSLIGTAVAWPRTGIAQGAAKRPLVAYLVAGSSTATARYVSGFPQGLQELGYVVGRDVEIVYRYADGDMARFPALAEELVGLHPDVIVTGPTASTLAAKQATSAIPIVSVALVDPEGFGFITTMARPGGQVTGILATLDSLPAKLLQLVLEVLPNATRIGLLSNTRNPSDAVYRRNAETAAASFARTLVPVEVSVPNDLEAGFQTWLRERVDLGLVLPDALFLSERRHIAELATAARMPTMYGYREHVEDGGLMSYGINIRENCRRAAVFVDKILKGVKPGDLPVELTTKFELVINLKTAKALGITIPPSIMVRADEVIE
jgi:putative ABC transport system substrate-binding protein